MNQKNSLLFISLIFLITISCKNSGPKDLSYTIEEYEMKGMPDPDSIWSDKDYVKAHIVLGKIRLSNFLSLPRKHSSKSGVVFSRIMNKENISFLDDTTQPFPDRAFRIQYFSSFLSELSRMYTDNLKKEQYYKEELIDIYIFRLYVQDKMLELANKIMNSNDPAVKGMKEGLYAVQHEYMNLVYVLLLEQVKSGIYPDSDLERLSTEISGSLKKNVKWMNPDNRMKINNQIQMVIEKSTLDPVKKNYLAISESYLIDHP